MSSNASSEAATDPAGSTGGPAAVNIETTSISGSKATSSALSEVTSKDLDQLVRDMIAATHKLVRSQMTWFRCDPDDMHVPLKWWVQYEIAKTIDCPCRARRSARDDEVFRWFEMSGSGTNSVADAIIAELSSPVHMGESVHMSAHGCTWLRDISIL